MTIETDTGFSNLFDKNSLERDQHKESEEGVIPVLVQAPQTHTEDLEHKERSSGPLPKQLPEIRQSYIQS